MGKLWDKNFTFFPARAGNKSYSNTRCNAFSHSRAIVDGLIIRMGVHKQQAAVLR
jgi:hypothetical protein